MVISQIKKSWFSSLLSWKKMTTLVDQVLASYGKPEKVKIKNLDKTENLLQSIISAGPKQLQVITDFDQTLTRYHLNGKRCDTSYGIIANSPLIPDKVKSDAWELYEKYYPIEIDVTMSKEEKHPRMVEWYEKSHESMLAHKSEIQSSHFENMVRDSQCLLRDNAKNLLETLHKHGIPTLILSAGMGNLVKEVLKLNSSLHPNMKVIANFMQFDDAGKLESFSEPVVHIFNKNEAALHDEHTNYFEDLKSRHNVILMGDSLGDTNMDTGVKDPNAVLKIGFLNTRFDDHLPTYMDSYDVVLIDDQSMDFVNSVMDLVIKPK